MAIASSRRPPVVENLGRLSTRALDRIDHWDRSLRQRRPVGMIMRLVQAPVTRDVAGSRFLVGPAILGTLATLLISVGVCQPSSPFMLKEPDAWFFGVSSQPGPTSHVFFGLACVYGGLVLFVRVWLGVIRAVTQTPGVQVKKLAWLLALWALPILLAPPIFSHDIYSYAAQGEMMTRHINPYQYGPYTLGQTSLTRLVDPLWQNTPSPYGPLFLQLAGIFTNVVQHDVLADLVLLRLLAVAGVVLFAAFLPTLARSVGTDPAKAFAFAVLNPVTILHLIGGGHNDALMVGFLVAGLAMAKRNHPVIGIVLCALAASVKAPAAIGIIYIGWEWVGLRVPFRERVRPVVTSVLIGGTVMGLLSLVSGVGWGWVKDLASPDSVRSWMAPATGIGIFFSGVLHLFGSTVSQQSVLSVVQFLGVLAALVSAAWLLFFRAEKIGSLRAIGLTLLLVVLLGPVIQPWYFSWAIVLLAPVAKGWMRRALTVVSVVLVFICFSGGTQLTNDLRSSYLDVAVTLLVLLGFFLVPLGPISREHSFESGPFASEPDPDAPHLDLGGHQRKVEVRQPAGASSSASPAVISTGGS